MIPINKVYNGKVFNNYSWSPNGPPASWAIDSEAMRARRLTVLVKSN